MKDLNYSAEILRLRKAEGLSLRQLADRCGIDRSNIQRYETGKLIPTEPTFLQILEGLGYTVQKKIVKLKK